MGKSIRASISILLLLLFGASCSNFLSDPRINPDLPRINRGTPALVPTVAGEVGEGEVTALSSVSMTLTWPEPVTDFDAGDIIPENAGVADFNGSGDTYTFDLVMNGEGVVSFTIPERSVSGSTGDTNSEYTFSFSRIASALTLAITSTEGPVTGDWSVPVTFTFSQDVSGFDASDISVSNGSLSGFSGSGDTYSATLHFAADGLTTLTVKAAVALDTATGIKGNSPAAFTISLDSTAPTVTLEAPITAGDVAGFKSLVFDILFSEAVTGFSVADIHVSNAALSGFSGSGSEYRVVVTPLSDGTVTVQVPADAGFDDGDNGNIVSPLFSYTYDSSTVAVNFVSSEADPTKISPITLDILFDLPMTGFTVGDLVPVNASLSGFTGTGDRYSVVLTPQGQGITGVSIAAAAALSVTSTLPNVASSFDYLYDSQAPAVPSFQAVGYDSGSPVSSGEAVNEFLKLDLVTDYTGDGGSPLSFEYTTDNGVTWDAFVDNTPLSAQGTYAGINIRVTDEAGNVSVGTAITGVTIDTVDPDAPLPAIGTDPVNIANRNAFSFSVSAGEPGADFVWELSSDGGGTPLTGSGSLDGSGSANLSGLDVSGLSDGALTLRVRQTDAAGNTGGWGQDAAPKDTVAPSAPVVVILSGDPVTSTDNDAFSFEISGGEDGAEWTYIVSSDGGGPHISASGTFDAAGSLTVSGMDVSALKDGSLTVSAAQEDVAGNTGVSDSDSVTLDATALNLIDLPDLVDNDNKGAVPVALTGEVGSTYSYTLSSSNGGATVSASGQSYDGSGQANLSLDLSGLNDGWLVMIVNVTDVNGNASSEYAVVEKSSVGPPDTGTADFSGEAGRVTFDASYHGYQTVPSGYVRFDTTDIIGSGFDDVFKFSSLENGESFTLDGGAGFNTIDLSSYTGDQIEIVSNNFVTPTLAGNGSGTLTVDLGSGQSAVIDFAGIEKFVFSSRIFDGTPHGLLFNYPDNGGAYIHFRSSTLIDLRAQPVASTAYGADGEQKWVSVILDYNGSLDSSYEAVVAFNSRSYNSLQYDGTTTGWHNAEMQFNFLSDTDYESIIMQAFNKRWQFGGEYTDDTGLDKDLTIRTELRVSGNTAELWKGAESSETFVDNHDFGKSLNDGLFAVAANSAWSEYSLALSPSNWAPYARPYDVRLSKNAMGDITLNLLADAEDAENESLSLLSISTSSNGILTDNGDGTVTYVPNGPFVGIDEFTYVIGDGTNTTEGSIRIDVIP